MIDKQGIRLRWELVGSKPNRTRYLARIAPGLSALSRIRAGNLHHFWDTEFVDQLGTDAKTIASDLIGHISKTQEQQRQSGWWGKGGGLSGDVGRVAQLGH
jgi:hypothetical protein